MVFCEVLETECGTWCMPGNCSALSWFPVLKSSDEVWVSWYLEHVELTKLPGTAISSALALETPSMSHHPSATLAWGLEMTWHLFLFTLCHFPHWSQSLLQKSKELYLVEEQWRAGRPQVDRETLLAWLCFWALDPSQNLEDFAFFFLSSAS